MSLHVLVYCVPLGFDVCGADREAVHEPAAVGAWGCRGPLLGYERQEETV